MMWREIHWLRPLSGSQVEGFLIRLASDVSIGPVIFEARAEAGTIRYLLGGEPANIQQASTLLRSMVPSTNLTPDPRREEVERAGRLRISQRSLSLTLQHDDNLLRSMLATLSAAKRDEDVLVVQVILAGAVAPQIVPDNVPSPAAPLLDTLLHGIQKAEAEVRSDMRNKLSQYRFRAVVRIGVAAKEPSRRKLLVLGILSAFRQMQSGSTTITLIRERPEHVDTGHIPVRRPLRITPPETLGILGWPCSDEELPGLPALHPLVVPPPKTYVASEERQFGVTTAPGVEVPVSIGAEDSTRHTHVVAPTGAGKSVLLLHLIKADIEAGRSVVVVDPKGDLATDVLSIIPPCQMGHVVVMNPLLPKPVGIEPLHQANTDPAVTADNVLAIFKELFPKNFGPRTSDTLHASILTLAMNTGTTLADLPRLLTDPKYRRSLTSKLDDPTGLGSFWAQYDALNPAQQAGWVGPVMSRLRQFTLRPALRAVLSQPQPRFELGELFTQPRILIVSLNKGILGSTTAALLGSLVVSQLWQLTLAQGSLPKDQRAPVSVYLDEAQMFLHLDGDLGEALEQSRSQNVSWHIAHQHMKQMPPDLLAGIDANCHNKITFALKAGDAKTVAASSSVLTQQDFTSLPPYHVYASLLSGGYQTEWFSARTLPPPEAISSPEAVIAESQARYGLLEPPADATTTTGDSADPDDDESIGRRRKEPS